MKVCGFTIVRNVIKYGYPVVESIKSLLPICDKIVVAVGKSDDDTLQLIKTIDPSKIEIVETVWDDSLRSGGQVLAVETNKAFDAVGHEFDWCIYLQADEVLHDKDYLVITGAMQTYLQDNRVEGLLLKYLHFWGTYDFVGISRSWYRNEIRIIRNDKSIRSYKDAQGFRKNDCKLKVKKIDATVYHYGYVRPPDVIKKKISHFHSFYHSGNTLQKILETCENFDYSIVDAVKKFDGDHPSVMQELMSNLNWKVDIDVNKIKLSPRERFLYMLERLFNYRFFEYKNYIILKK